MCLLLIFIEQVLHANPWAKSFTFIIGLNPYTNPRRQVLFIVPILQRRKLKFREVK